MPRWLSIRRSCVSGHRMRIRATREVIVQGLNGRYARVTNETARDLRDRLVRDAAGFGDLRPVSLTPVQSEEDEIEHSGFGFHDKFRALG